LKNILPWLLALFCLLILSVESAEKKIELSERHKKWLEEEVVYIITALEKEVFQQLETDRERDLFIEAFWKQRDPSPGSPTNEFREEHYKRINYVNHFFGRSSPKAGWRTDRGEIYIILGAPNDITRYEGKSQIYNTEVWFYQGLSKYGLPSGFNLVFFQEGGTGEYRLYSPLKDGPQALMTSYFGDAVDYLSAYKQLREFEPMLADVSMSLIPGEGSIAMGRPSLSSDVLIQRVFTTPAREIKERYAKKFLEYKNIVEVEYSTNYMDSSSIVKLVKDSSGINFIHFAIEPERLSVNQFENKFYTTLKLNGTVTTMDDVMIHQFEKEISLEFDEEQMREANLRPLSIRDMFPLIPGTYKMSVLLKNEVSKEFTSIERNLFVPGEEDGLQMTSLIMGYQLNRRAPEQDKLRPFQMGMNQIYVQANQTFLRTDTLVLAFQLHGLTQAQREQAVIKYRFLKDGEAFKTFDREVKDYLSSPDVIETFALQEFSPAHYRVEILLQIDGREVLQEKDNFDVTHQAAIARPWTYARLMPGTSNPVYAYLIGNQLYHSGRVEEARDYIEKAYRSNPESVEFAISLARVYMKIEEYKQVESILQPLLDRPEHPPYEVYFVLARAHQGLGQLDKAIAILDSAIDYFGVNTNLLNTVGDCYYQLGRYEEALVAWERSLEINPNQPELKKDVEAIKENNDV